MRKVPIRIDRAPAGMERIHVGQGPSAAVGIAGRGGWQHRSLPETAEGGGHVGRPREATLALRIGGRLRPMRAVMPMVSPRFVP